MIAFVDRSNDSVVVLQSEWHPPGKSRFVVNPKRHGTLSNLKQVSLLQIGKLLPTGGPVLPCDAKGPTDSSCDFRSKFGQQFCLILEIVRSGESDFA